MLRGQILYRPVGLLEMVRIFELNLRAFPPRFEWQPIFYPVLLEDYAIQIARDWNTGDAASGYAGYVTAFRVDSEYLQKFAVQVVGAEDLHQELWIPAEELAEFNSHILEEIRVTRSFFGPQFQGRHRFGHPRSLTPITLGGRRLAGSL